MPEDSSRPHPFPPFVVPLTWVVPGEVFTDVAVLAEDDDGDVTVVDELESCAATMETRIAMTARVAMIDLFIFVSLVCRDRS